MTRHLLTLADLSADALSGLLTKAAEVKARPERYRSALAGKKLAMIFQKRSTRTRVSFEVGMYELGGTALFLSSDDLQLGRGETIEDTARVLSRYVDGIMARVYAHADLVKLTAGTVPVINGLSDRFHPCQCLADLQTLAEVKGRAPGAADGSGVAGLAGLTLTYVGDGNNVANSLMIGGAKVGVHVRVAAPPGYEPDPAVVATARAGATAGATVTVTNDPAAACAGADAVYTDVWASMGQEAEGDARRRAFAGFRVDEALFAKAKPDAIFLHCLPAHRGEEVTDGVVDHPRSRVLDQAENRLHAQKALMIELMA